MLGKTRYQLLHRLIAARLTRRACAGIQYKEEREIVSRTNLRLEARTSFVSRWCLSCSTTRFWCLFPLNESLALSPSLLSSVVRFARLVSFVQFFLCA